MARKRMEPLPDLETVAEAEAFGGFTSEDFAVFDAAEFGERMTLIRSRIKPKLARLGETLAPLLSQEYGRNAISAGRAASTAHGEPARNYVGRVWAGRPRLQTFSAFARRYLRRGGARSRLRGRRRPDQSAICRVARPPTPIPFPRISPTTRRYTPTTCPARMERRNAVTISTRKRCADLANS